jgi:hypothetical protein
MGVLIIIKVVGLKYQDIQMLLLVVAEIAEAKITIALYLMEW